MLLPIIILITILPQQESFKETQLNHSRVKAAFEEKENTVKGYFTDRNLDYSGFQLFLRAFKYEQIIEVWVREKNAERFTFLRQYPFCTTSGTLGPKRKEGDLQIPEGIYYILGIRN